MTLRFEVSLSSHVLYNGRRSFYASLTLCSRSWFLSRWDSVRVRPSIYIKRQADIWRGPVMTWYRGRY